MSSDARAVPVSKWVLATHVRIGDPSSVGPIIFGVLIWLGLYLRDPRLRALLPLRS